MLLANEGERNVVIGHFGTSLLVELNFTFVIFTASFIVFIGLMKLVFFGPVERVINKRESFVADNINASKSSLQKIEAQIADTDASSILIKARQDSQKILSQAIEEANKEKSKLVGDAVRANKDMIINNVIGLEKEENEISKNLSAHIKEVSSAAIAQLMSEIEGKQKAAV